MNFTFSKDQLLFQEEVRRFLIDQVTTTKIRSLWDTETGRCSQLWRQCAELGMTSVTVPTAFDGLGLSMIDFVLLAQACGYVAMPEPLVHNMMVAVPFLNQLQNSTLNQRWLPKIISGDAVIIVGLDEQEFFEDLHIADLLILEKNMAFYTVDPSTLSMRANQSIDPSRKLFAIDFDEQQGEKIAEGEQAKELAEFVRYSGALSIAAQSLGLTQRMLDITVKYTTEREQFGKAIGSFQAVKHHMANIAYQLEYAKAPVYRAAYALGENKDMRIPLYVSHAKIAACEVANLAAKNCIQVHGAMGYTWEVDLHIFMKRAWAFTHVWGDMAFLKNRVADYVFSDEALLGAGKTFI